MSGAALWRPPASPRNSVLSGDLDPTNRVLKRAQYEAFALSLLDGNVRVRNESHQDPADHEYRVTITDCVPTAREWPADDVYETPGKHRVAVAIRTKIITLATDVQAITDRGFEVSSDHALRHSDSSTPETGDRDQLSGTLQCWNCVRTGRKYCPQ